jgi:uncharacterized protein
VIWHSGAVAAAGSRDTDRFAVGVAEQLGHYVYLLIDPATGRPFYVGKGIGDRCFAHLHEARRTTADTRGDYPKLATIRAIEAAGGKVRIDILRHGLTEPEAYAVEAAAIDLLGMTDLRNRVVGSGTLTVGRMSLGDIIARYAAQTLEIIEGEALVLIRVSRAYERGISDEQLYEVTRGWWRISPKRARRAARVLSVFGGVVRAVYRPTEWVQPTHDLIAEDPTRAGRWGFVGTPDPEGEDCYLHRDVTAHLPLGAQNPVRYVNC